ncbi:hypothetical protein ET532_011960, partial [Verminephrobacter sp. Larva24]
GIADPLVHRGPGHDGQTQPDKALASTHSVANTMATTITFDKQVIKNGETAQVTFTFTDPNHTLSPGSLTTTGGLIHSIVNRGVINGQRVYTATFLPTGNLESSFHRIRYGVAGEADYANSGNIHIDTRPPVVLGVSFDKSDLRPGEKATITLTFSEPVRSDSFGLEDLRVGAGKG